MCLKNTKVSLSEMTLRQILLSFMKKCCNCANNIAKINKIFSLFDDRNSIFILDLLKLSLLVDIPTNNILKQLNQFSFKFYKIVRADLCLFRGLPVFTSKFASKFKSTWINMSLQSNSIDVCMKVRISCIIKGLVLLILIGSASCVKCDPSFSAKYCQMLQKVNMSNGKNEQCHKQDEKCPVQIYKNYSRPPSNNFIMEIKAKKNAIHSYANIQQALVLSEIAAIIAEQLFLFFSEILNDLLQSLSLEILESPPIQYSDNFASLDGGAMILRLSSNKIKAAQSILQYNADRYLYTDEKLPLQIIIALKEQVSIERIVIKSSEIYSSIMNEFIVYGAIALNNEQNEQDSWSKLVQAKAKYEAGQQEYRTIKKVVRYLKLRIISAHGDWKYFTITQIKVYGSSVYAEAMTNYQSNNNEYNVQPDIDTSSMHLIQDLKKMILLARQGNKTIPQNNLITYFFQELQKLTKIQEQQIFYLNNLTLKIKQLQNKTQQLINKDISLHKQSSNRNTSAQQTLFRQKDWLHYKQIYQRECQSPTDQHTLLTDVQKTFEIEQNQTKNKTQSFFRLLYQIQKDSLQKAEIKKQIDRLNKQLMQLRSNSSPLSQLAFMIINIVICVVVSLIVGGLYLSSIAKKGKKELQINPKIVQNRLSKQYAF